MALQWHYKFEQNLTDAQGNRNGKHFNGTIPTPSLLGSAKHATTAGTTLVSDTLNPSDDALLIVFAGAYNSGGGSGFGLSISDSFSETLTWNEESIGNTNTDAVASIFWARLPSTVGSGTVTVTVDSSCDERFLHCCEITGIDSASNPVWAQNSKEETSSGDDWTAGRGTGSMYDGTAAGLGYSHGDVFFALMYTPSQNNTISWVNMTELYENISGTGGFAFAYSKDLNYYINCTNASSNQLILFIDCKTKSPDRYSTDTPLNSHSIDIQNDYEGVLIKRDALTTTLGNTTLSSGRTVSMWVKPTAVNVNQILYEEGGGGQGMFLGIKSDGSLVGGGRTGGTTYTASGGTLVAGEWHHVALTYNGTTTWKVYINGTLINTNSTSASVTTHDDPLGIGRSYVSNSSDTLLDGSAALNQYKGLIADFRYYDDEQTGTNIANLADDHGLSDQAFGAMNQLATWPQEPLRSDIAKLVDDLHTNGMWENTWNQFVLHNLDTEENSLRDLSGNKYHCTVVDAGTNIEWTKGIGFASKITSGENYINTNFKPSTDVVYGGDNDYLIGVWVVKGRTGTTGLGALFGAAAATNNRTYIQDYRGGTDKLDGRLFGNSSIDISGDDADPGELLLLFRDQTAIVELAEGGNDLGNASSTVDGKPAFNIYIFANNEAGTTKHHSDSQHMCFIQGKATNISRGTLKTLLNTFRVQAGELLESDMTGSSTVGAAIEGDGEISSSLTGSSTLSAGAEGDGEVSADLDGSSTMGAAIEGDGEISVDMFGSSVVVVDTEGDLAFAIDFDGSSTVVVTLTGDGETGRENTLIVAMDSPIQRIVDLDAQIERSTDLDSQIQRIIDLDSELKGDFFVFTNTFVPTELGTKLLRWYHPNDPDQVVESSGIITLLRDKGSDGADLTGNGAGNGPVIANGEVSFDGVNDDLSTTNALRIVGTDEYFMAMKSSTTFRAGSASQDQNFRHMMIVLRDVAGAIKGGLRCQTASGVNIIVADVDVGLDTMCVVGIRKTGTFGVDGEYVININGVDYSNSGISVIGGSNNGAWITELIDSPDNFCIANLKRGTSLYHPGTMGKAGFIATASLTTEERTNLINWMKTESGIQ